ncbi:MAG: outer membrane beta-barrel protein [Burkholderiales bacterium]
MKTLLQCRLVGVCSAALAAACLWSAAAGAQEKSINAPAAPGTSATVPAEGTKLEQETVSPGPAPGRTVKPEEPVVATGTPFSAGSFLVYPEIDATWMYDDNLYYSNSNPVSDHAWIYSPAIWAQSNWTRHALNFYAAWDSTRYQRYGSEDSDDWRVSGEGRYDFNADTNVYGGARFSQDHEDRESPDARNGLTPTKYYQRRFYGGFFHQLGRVSVRVAGTAQHLNYDDVNFVTGSGAINIINNDDRDRWQYTGGVRLGYEASPRIEPYLQLALDNRRYDAPLDDLSYQRDSDGRRYLVGVRWNVPRKVKLDAFAGRLKQDYADARFNDVSAPVAGAALVWAVGPRTIVSAYVDRTVEETTVTYTPTPGNVLVSSSYLNTYVSAGLEHRFTDKLSGRINGSISRVAYEGFDRTDDYKGGNIGLVYRLHRNLFLDLNLAARKLESSLPSENFTKRMVFVRIAVPLSH